MLLLANLQLPRRPLCPVNVASCSPFVLLFFAWRPQATTEGLPASTATRKLTKSAVVDKEVKQFLSKLRPINDGLLPVFLEANCADTKIRTFTSASIDFDTIHLRCGREITMARSRYFRSQRWQCSFPSQLIHGDSAVPSATTCFRSCCADLRCCPYVYVCSRHLLVAHFAVIQRRRGIGCC